MLGECTDDRRASLSLFKILSFPPTFTAGPLVVESVLISTLHRHLPLGSRFVKAVVTFSEIKTRFFEFFMPMTLDFFVRASG